MIIERWNRSFYLSNIDMVYTWIIDFTRNHSHKDDFLIKKGYNFVKIWQDKDKKTRTQPFRPLGSMSWQTGQSSSGTICLIVSGKTNSGMDLRELARERPMPSRVRDSLDADASRSNPLVCECRLTCRCASSSPVCDWLRASCCSCSEGVCFSSCCCWCW